MKFNTFTKVPFEKGRTARIFARNLHFTNNYKLDKINLFNGNSIAILPSIDSPEFIGELLFLLKSLDKSSRYELEFSLYLRTNDDNKNKKLFDLPIDEANTNSDLPIGNFLMSQVIFENMYKHKGFFGFITDEYLYNSKEDLFRYIKSIRYRLGVLVVNTNEILDRDGFIEFKRPVILNIKVLDKNKD